MDEYMPFGLALRRWVESFRRLGIQFRGATMQLDLLNAPANTRTVSSRPVPAGSTKGEWVPGQINFTAEATPDQVGSGSARSTRCFTRRHAAHFANVVQNSPCFAGYAPTSMGMRKRSPCSATACWRCRLAGAIRAQSARRHDPASVDPRPYRRKSTAAIL
jgi:hypothetical protein